jgi:acetyl-CoA carboxylase carboxyltransferase component
MTAVLSPLQGTVVSIEVAEGDAVRAGQSLVVIESMKMEHVVAAPFAGVVAGIPVAVGDTVMPDGVLVDVEEREGQARDDEAPATAEADVRTDATVRADLAEVIERHEVTLDARRPDAVERRRATGQRTARENVADLLDEGTFVEYAPLVVAAQRRRRPLDELIRRTPADGLVGGIGKVDGSPVIAMSYDYTVLAGTQGLWNHEKKDRLFELAERLRAPVVFFTEGGGGRPGDTDGSSPAYLDCHAFNYFARLSGLVPLVGINSGYCFAGNAALLGCCDVIIATSNSNIGMGGPAMIEGGGLGAYDPREIGPMDVQVANGVVDVAVADETEAVAVAKRYLSYFRGPSRGPIREPFREPIDDWSCADQAVLRGLVPENRVRAYDVRLVIDSLFDTGSVLELRRGWGDGIVTALARVEGRPIGVIANNPTHLGGAIDVDAADKSARFMQLCDAFDVPIVFLCDTPGFMVGPDHEARAAIRHVTRLFVTGANLTVPFGTVVLRKGYGLGAQGMTGGSFKAPLFCVAWPTGEFGGMNIEGAVRLGQRRELEAIDDPDERARVYQEMVDRMYEQGRAVSMADHFEIDDVIDPADTRSWITRMLESSPPPPPRRGKKRAYIDTW